MEETVSPFLTLSSRAWGKHLALKSAGLAALLFALAFSTSFFNLAASHFFLSCVYFLVGTPALISALHDLKNLEINIDILMTSAAFLSVLIGSGLEGALLLVLFELSHGMEQAVSRKAKSALHNLNHLAPKRACVIVDEVLFDKAVSEIPVGTHLFVKHGEIAPLDCRVIKGSSSVNLIHLTGESLPIPKTVGDPIPAGAHNLEAALIVEVTRTSADSTLSRMIRLIAEAQEAKPRLQRWLDRFGHRYALTVIALTGLFALFLPLFLTISYLGHEGSIYRALAFLIAASPCALIIATPTAYLSAISACARKGILLKGGITLDALASCKQVAFDKTGTLTTGELQCTAIEPLGATQFSIEDALSIAYGLERQIVHPIATAICTFAERKQCPCAEIGSFQATPGLGLEGKYDGEPVMIGLPEHIGTQVPPAQKEQIQKWATSKSIAGQVLATLLIGRDLFCFRFADSVRKETSKVLQELLKEQITPIMLTGDHWANAKIIGTQLGIDHIFANLRPEDKLAKVAELAQTGALAMVGDGINDAPALARATVGISMGRIGSATAVDASDVVLLNDDLHLLPWLFHKSRMTGRIVQQNLTLAMAVILLATTPALLGLVPLWAAVLLHEGGTVLVGLNSLRLLKK